MNINIADLVTRAKALYAFMKDPANGWYAKFRAFTDFVTYVLPYLPGASTVLPFAARAENIDGALAGVESLGAHKGKQDDADVTQKVITFLVTLAPLDCCDK